jgi:hypothetical protein
VDPAKWPALKALIVKRAAELKATGAPGVKGTWPFQGANDDGGAISLATMTRTTPAIRGAADIQLARSAGRITAMHKGSGRAIGSIAPAGKGWAGTHADGTPTGSSGSQQGALTGLVAYHNARARRLPPAQQDGTAAMPGAKTYTADEQMALEFAGSLPYTSAASSSDGPRVTTMSAGKPSKGVPAVKLNANQDTDPAVSTAAAKLGLSAEGAKVYARLIKKGLKPNVALAFAKRAAAMKAKYNAQGPGKKTFIAA